MLGKKEGMGQLRSASGDLYIGEFKNDHYHGKGQLKYGASTTGELYNGFFDQGRRHGFGLHISNNQLTHFHGEWQFDRRHGRGVLTLVNPDTKNQKDIEGEWIDDVFQFDRIVKVIIKDQQGKTISSIECKVDNDFNPIL